MEAGISYIIELKLNKKTLIRFLINRNSVNESKFVISAGISPKLLLTGKVHSSSYKERLRVVKPWNLIKPLGTLVMWFRDKSLSKSLKRHSFLPCFANPPAISLWVPL
jgi:hypothetical protein